MLATQDENIFWLRRRGEIARTLPRPKSRMEEQPNFSLETWSTKFRDCYRCATSKSFVGCPRQISKISDDPTVPCKFNAHRSHPVAAVDSARGTDITSTTNNETSHYATTSPLPFFIIWRRRASESSTDIAKISPLTTMSRKLRCKLSVC